MPRLTVIYGAERAELEVAAGSLIGEGVRLSGLPLEQPCAGRGTCGKCKVLVEAGVNPPDEIEYANLTPGELAVGNRLACRATVAGDLTVTLSPIVVYSNKNFRSSSRFRKGDVPLGLAIDLGSTTVAAFLTMLDNGEVAAGAATLNQQAVYGADVISRLAAAIDDPEDQNRLFKLALASINQAIDSLNLSQKVRDRIERVTIVGNVAMHHLLMRLPVETLGTVPFQPFSRDAAYDAGDAFGGIFPAKATVNIPPVIGGFVGSDALACLAYFDFDKAPYPMAAIDLGTNGEVMVTDGKRILVASTAAGPAFEGVNISCGTRAVDGAVVRTTFDNGHLALESIGDEAPVGLTGSGLLSAVGELYRAGVVDVTGRIQPDNGFGGTIDRDAHDVLRVALDADETLFLTQVDIRELQKAKAAIRACIDILMGQLGLAPADLKRVILTGSFGGQVGINDVIDLGMIPPVNRDVVETIANGAGLGAALFLDDAQFARGVALAQAAEQIDLDLDPDFNERFVLGMYLSPDLGGMA